MHPPVTEEHRTQLAEHGFVVIPSRLPDALLKAAMAPILRFVKADLDDPASWYGLPRDSFGIVPLHHPQAFWDTRQDPAIYAIFRELLGLEALWVTMDRGSFRAPADASRGLPREPGRLHWDHDPAAAPTPRRLQAVLYLTDTTPAQAAFQAIPGLFRDLDGWLDAHGVPEGWTVPADHGYHVEHVAGCAGDLVIWDARLPHGVGPNDDVRPRISQYVSMGPAGDEAARAERIRCIEARRAPVWFRGWLDQPDPEPGPPVSLSRLGRKIAGLDRW